jgi:hypothetical protein
MAARMAKIGVGNFGHAASLAAWRRDHKFAQDLRFILRHAWACPGHPRLSFL